MPSASMSVLRLTHCVIYCLLFRAFYWTRAREPYLHAISHWCGLVHLVQCKLEVIISCSYDLENRYFDVFSHNFVTVLLLFYIKT